MKKYKLYLITILVTIFVGVITYYVSDYSSRVRIIFSLFKENDKQKIISSLTEKVESDSMKHKLEIALKKFALNISEDHYTDEHLKNLMKEFERISNQDKIDSIFVEKFYENVNREF